MRLCAVAAKSEGLLEKCLLIRPRFVNSIR